MNEGNISKMANWPANEEIVGIFGAVLFLVCAYAYAGIIFVGWEITIVTTMILFSAMFISLVPDLRDDEWLLAGLISISAGIIGAIAIGLLVGGFEYIAYPRGLIIEIPTAIGLAFAIAKRAFLLLARDQNKNISN